MDKAMEKNLRIIFVIIFLISIPTAILFYKIDFPLKPKSEGCVFCDPTILEAQSFYETKLSWALIPYKPVVEGHILILPKRHVERLEQVTQEEMADFKEVLEKVDPILRKLAQAGGSLILEKNGPEAGQSVPHVHIHYLPRSQKQGQVSFILSFFMRPWLKPLSATEMQEKVTLYRELML